MPAQFEACHASAAFYCSMKTYSQLKYHKLLPWKDCVTTFLLFQRCAAISLVQQTLLSPERIPKQKARQSWLFSHFCKNRIWAKTRKMLRVKRKTAMFTREGIGSWLFCKMQCLFKGGSSVRSWWCCLLGLIAYKSVNLFNLLYSDIYQSSVVVYYHNIFCFAASVYSVCAGVSL